MTVLSAPVAYPSDVPDTAAPMPTKRAFAGTWMFNALAAAVVISITAFVVYAPFDAGSADGPQGAVSGPDSGLPPGGAGSDGAGDGDDGDRAFAVPDRIDRATTSTAPDAAPPGEAAAVDLQQVAATVPVQLIYVTSPTTKAPATTTTTRPPATATTTTTRPPATNPPPATTTTPPVTSTTTTVAPTTTAPTPQCRDFATQPEAQAVFDADPAGLAHFDGDGDGIACEDLPGRPPPVTAPPPSAEPPPVESVIRPTTRYYGVHTREAPFWMADFDQFATDAGKTPNLDMFFASLGDAFPAAQVDALWARGVLPMVTMEPIVTCSSEPVPLPGYDCSRGQPTLSDISDGMFDDYFREWASAAAANGKPVVLRFAHEMNGNWYPWGGTASGNEPGDYVPAWQHVHDIFEAAGATNVVWFWSVNRVDNLRDKSVAAYYPGDAYVDWVGLSGYYRYDNVAPTFDATFAATLAELRKVAPAKPVVLGETAAGTSNSRRVTWTTDFFAGLLEHPEIWGFVWFNDSKNDNDWRIQYSAQVTAAFAAGVADPRYGTGISASSP